MNCACRGADITNECDVHIEVMAMCTPGARAINDRPLHVVVPCDYRTNSVELVDSQTE